MRGCDSEDSEDEEVSRSPPRPPLPYFLRFQTAYGPTVTIRECVDSDDDEQTEELLYVVEVKYTERIDKTFVKTREQYQVELNEWSDDEAYRNVMEAIDQYHGMGLLGESFAQNIVEEEQSMDKFYSLPIPKTRKYFRSKFGYIAETDMFEEIMRSRRNHRTIISTVQEAAPPPPLSEPLEEYNYNSVASITPFSESQLPTWDDGPKLRERPSLRNIFPELDYVYNSEGKKMKFVAEAETPPPLASWWGRKSSHGEDDCEGEVRESLEQLRDVGLTTLVGYFCLGGGLWFGGWVYI